MLETNRRIPGINYHCNACTYRKGYFFLSKENLVIGCFSSTQWTIHYRFRQGRALLNRYINYWANLAPNQCKHCPNAGHTAMTKCSFLHDRKRTVCLFWLVDNVAISPSYSLKENCQSFRKNHYMKN